jgi:hypothetical protein
MARANRASRRPQFVPQQFGRTTPSSARHPDDLLKAFAELVRGHLYDRGEFASLASICRFPGPDHVAHAFQVVMRFIRLNPKSGLQERRDAMPEPRTPPSLKAGTSSRTRMEKSAAGAHPPQRPSKLIAAENAADVGRGNRPRRAGRRRGGRGAPGKHSRECRNRGTGGSGPAGSIEGGIGNGIAGSAASGAARAAAGAWGRVGGAAARARRHRPPGVPCRVAAARPADARAPAPVANFARAGRQQRLEREQHRDQQHRESHFVSDGVDHRIPASSHVDSVPLRLPLLSASRARWVKRKMKRRAAASAGDASPPRASVLDAGNRVGCNAPDVFSRNPRISCGLPWLPNDSWNGLPLFIRDLCGNDRVAPGIATFWRREGGAIWLWTASADRLD